MKVLSFDIGTTNIKSILYIDKKVVLRESKRIKTKQSGEIQTQNSLEILAYLKEKIDSLEDLDRIVLSVPMHTLILLDNRYEPISEMMLWSDRRGTENILNLDKKIRNDFQKITHVPVHSMTPFSKILWIKSNGVNYCYLSDLKSYLMVHLTGEFVTDISTAASWGMVNHDTLMWDEKILKHLDVDRETLPNITSIYSRFTYNKIEVIIGATDGVMATRGVEALENQLVLSIGTSIGLRKLTKNKQFNPKLFSYYAYDDLYLVGTASNNGGNLFDYVNDNIRKIKFSEYIDMLNHKPPKIFAIPYAYGERGPFWKEGLSLKFKGEGNIDDKVQSILLGMFANLKLMIEQVDSLHEEILVTGNFMRDPALRQHAADIIERRLVFIEDEDAVCSAFMTDISKDRVIYYPRENHDLNQYMNKSMEYIRKYAEKRE